ncbi:response regulator transcription factor [Terriglobus sp. ADX1]|uniref:response regulator transcription factor n=1 Tax=Terriglobus sp. ADX1 TaxID=2794063 RepID=UPI002FE60258
MGASNCIKVLCADDHPLIRDGIAFAIRDEADMELVAQASNGLEAIAAFRKHQPDVTLMDIRMPEMDGIASAAMILNEFPHARIVMLTTYAGDVNASRAIKNGVSGYLLKGMLRTELIKTIRRVHAGQKHISPEIAQKIAAHIKTDKLTSREIEVLRTIATGKSNKAVATSLGISEDTVKGHVRNLLSKLRANDRTHAVLIAMERGYFE